MKYKLPHMFGYCLMLASVVVFVTAAVDQKQVERLKAEAYTASAKQLVRLYSDVASTE